MPGIYRREVQRIMQSSSSGPVRDIGEIVIELEDLLLEAEAAGYETLSERIRLALDQARKQSDFDGS